MPDFRNLGVILRILVLVTGMTLLAAVLRTSTLDAWLQASFGAVAFVVPVTILSLLVLAAGAPWLRRADYRLAVVSIVILELGIVTLIDQLTWALIEGGGVVVLPRYWLLTVITTLLLIGYFHLRNRALSPALTEARLQA
ncbi:MAG: hypothetical protein ACREB3_05835, partial [Burkholderiales bacterium]